VASHRVVEEWMGERVQTLEDLLRPGLSVVCVGINPSCVSVETGHYYQGRLGKLFLSRLRRVGLLPAVLDGYEDDALYARGVGFTDLIKRPTARASGLRGEEFGYGRAILLEKLSEVQPRLVIFTYKRVAQVLFGRVDRPGPIRRRDVLSPDGFLMPGRYERRDRVDFVLSRSSRAISSLNGSSFDGRRGQRKAGGRSERRQP
jgi:double-stranded uracil-DNA glycosylase